MPREAATAGALDEVASLAQIPRELLARLRQIDGH
jgi:chemotaxis response regulator CheB